MKMIVKYPHSVDYKGKLYLPGESIDLDEKEAKRLYDKDRVDLPLEEEIIMETPDIKDMTVAELKDLLDKLEVEYDARAKKDELVALAMKKTAEPPKN